MDCVYAIVLPITTTAEGAFGTVLEAVRYLSRATVVQMK
jgi:hypothetical protein